MAKHFGEKLSSQFWEQSGKEIGDELDKSDCAFVQLGTALLHRVEFKHFEYTKFAQNASKYCGREAYKEFNRSEYYKYNITDNNTPDIRCFALEMELFNNEPSWNYAKVVGIDFNKCKAVIQFGEALQQIVQSQFDTVTKGPIQIKGQRRILNLNEFKIFRQILESIEDKENCARIRNYLQKFNKKLSLSEKISALEELANILGQIIRDYKEEPLQLHKPLMTFDNYHWVNFKLLLTLAIRLSAKIEQIGLFLSILISASNNCYASYEFFDYKIQIRDNKLVEINSPTWLLPYYVNYENQNEIKLKEARENFHFLYALSKFSPTLFEVFKMAKTLSKIDANGDIWSADQKSKSRIFQFVMQFLTKSNLTEQNKINVQNCFCILSFFVEQLLEKAINTKRFPLVGIESISMAHERFAEKQQQLCADKRSVVL
ncbi:hypothetical protein niasHS_016816 [Heterodera schachtii]|uniref:Uncharacterized protein n=1 Tax=Heterodera schachtii TaxID=97005 RepID=A0ABD2HRQ6_HETSC